MENPLLVDYGLAAWRTEVSHSVLISLLTTLHFTHSWCTILESFYVVVAVLLVELRETFSTSSRLYALLPSTERIVSPHVATQVA